jgi:hypothetical protein
VVVGAQVRVDPERRGDLPLAYPASSRRRVAAPGLTPASRGIEPVLRSDRSRTVVRPKWPLACNNTAYSTANAQVGERLARVVSVTRKRKDGRTEWIPPPHLDSGQSRVNNYHHPEKYLVEDDEHAGRQR